MRRWMAMLAACWLLALAGVASAKTTVICFPEDDPPQELLDTAMAVVQGNTVMTLTFGGDCTLGGDGAGARRFARLIEENGDAYPFANLLPLFSWDDLTLVNLEGVLSDRILTKVDKEFNFIGATAYTSLLTLGGVECVTLANNHALDYGQAGKRDTEAALTDAGIAWCDDTTLAVLDKDGVRIGFTGSAMGIDEARYASQVATLRELGCTAIVHVMHAGQEYVSQPTGTQRRIATVAARAGAALVVGHHPHVVQGVEQLDNTTVAYSLGNCVFGGNSSPSDEDAYLLQATFRFTDGVLVTSQITLWPIRITSAGSGNNYQPVLLTGADAARVMDRIQQVSGLELTPFKDGQGAVQPEIDWR